MKACLSILLVLWSLPLLAQSSASGMTGRPITELIDEYRSQGYAFVYSTNLLDESFLVTAEPTATDPIDIVREVLAPYNLTVRQESGALLVVRLDAPNVSTASVLLIVTRQNDEQAVEDPSIDFAPALTEAARLQSGVYEYTEVPPGRYELTVEALGLATSARVVDVWPGESKIISVRLSAALPEIETIAVSASRYEILREIAPSGFSIDQRTIQTLPDIGDDPMRAIQRLPGAAASGASAKTYLRGGDRGEVGIVLNGLRLFDPFHVRDYQSIFSAIDSRALEGIEVFTGGFPVRYGNRMSGMVLMESLEPLEDRHTEIGVSVYNTSLLTAGRNGNRSWLFSTRRGNLDLVIKPEFGSPSYYDVFGEYTWSPSPNLTLSWNALYASDRVEIILESDPEELERVVSDTDNAQLWMQIDNRWSDALQSKTVLSATWFDNLRRGSLGDEEKIVANVFDDRRVLQFGFRQDFLYRHSDSRLLQWGLQVRQADADYAYRGSAEYSGLPALFPGRDEPLARSLTATPEGASYALYVSDRWKVSAKNTLEWGLRWDDQTYTDLASDSQISPRISLLRAMGENTEFRLSWGRYHQAQEINELQIEDGIANFWPAQRADHLIAGVRHLFGDRYALRIELFEKKFADVQPRCENLFDPLALIPEVQADRVRLDPAGARSRGLEVSIDRSDGPLTWWATYTLSEATDRIGGRNELRSWDQRHAFIGGVGYSDEKWEWGVVANVHSGWPLTELRLIETGVDADGEPEFEAIPGRRNADRHDLFTSLDFRIARKWKLGQGALTAFLEVSNLTNRRNPCCLDFDLEEDEATGVDVFERGIDYWMPLLPAIGVLWEF